MIRLLYHQKTVWPLLHVSFEVAAIKFLWGSSCIRVQKRHSIKPELCSPSFICPSACHPFTFSFTDISLSWYQTVSGSFRNIQFFGLESQQKVTQSYVVVIGLGGVGSHAATMLLRSGVGRLLLVDFDQVRYLCSLIVIPWLSAA